MDGEGAEGPETSDGVIDCEDTTVALKSVGEVEEEIRKLAVVNQRIWYKSGRVLYPADEEEAEKPPSMRD